MEISRPLFALNDRQLMVAVKISPQRPLMTLLANLNRLPLAQPEDSLGPYDSVKRPERLFSVYLERSYEDDMKVTEQWKGNEATRSLSS